jgi:hypothetical protein
MMRRIRIVLGIIILTVSLALLVWGFLPLEHEIRTQPLDASELQLPTPITFLSQQEFVL